MLFFFKALFSGLIVESAATLAKKSVLAGAVVASLPLVSMLVIAWLYLDTKDTGKIITMSYSIFWAVLPSLIFFLILPLLLKAKLHFGWSMLIASFVMMCAYTVYVIMLKKLGIS
jgi:hypothetical protein